MPAPIDDIDALVARGGEFMPYWGWHDDHRHLDGTPEYRPALQQVRSEFAEFLGVLAGLDGPRTSCLQLGMGECRASHRAWGLVFPRVLTVDHGVVMVGDEAHPGADTASDDALAFAERCAPYDLVFADAGHTQEDAARDRARFWPLLRPGGIFAFHDALRRPGFEDAVQVWRYLETLNEPVHLIGREVGIAWLPKE